MRVSDMQNRVHDERAETSRILYGLQQITCKRRTES